MRSRTGRSGRYSALGSAVAIAHLVTKILPPGSHQVRAESTSPFAPFWPPPPAGVGVDRGPAVYDDLVDVRDRPAPRLMRTGHVRRPRGGPVAHARVAGV